MRKLTTSEFVVKAIAVHGNRYSYDQSVYLGKSVKVVIICSKHGCFKQTPDGHLQGRGCPKCGRETCESAIRSTTNEFIEKAIIIYGDRYGYDKSIYVNRNTNVIITCREHGDFEQTPSTHLRGPCGCPKCARIVVENSRRSNIDKFIEKAIAIYGGKYTYDKSVYVNATTKIVIVCKEHGDFEQVPDSHLHGHGCPKCGGCYQLTTKDFIDKARIIHGNKYSYDKSIYINANTKLIITCPKHGDFKQTPDCHNNSTNGCPKCVSSISYISSRWLDSLGVPDDVKHREVKKLIPGRNFRVDGFIPDTKTVYEFYGDDVHGNPLLCNPDNKNRFGITYRDAYQKTIDREKIFKDAGFNLVTIWESDFRRQLLREFVESQIHKSMVING